MPTGTISLIGGLPAPSGRSLVGVFFNDLSLVTSSYNIFTNLTSGLVARNTDANILENSFSNMQPPVNAYSNYDHRGVGVAAERDNDELYIVVLTNSTFEQCRIGLFSAFVNLKVYGNEMRSVRTGITASLPNMGSVAIGGEGANRNDILASHNGILAAGFATNSVLQIENNLISLSAANGRRGIRLAGSLSETADMEDNRIRLNGTGRGMELLALENTRVKANNIVLLNSPQANYGISLRDAEQVLLEGNTVRGSAVTGDADKNIGIEIFSSPDIGYCCNTLDDTRLGVRVLGSSLSTDQFRGTSFGDHATGLQLETGSLLGSQSHTENTWIGSYSSGFGAVYDVDPQIADQFQFLVDNTGSNGDPVFLTTFSPTTWFQIGENPFPQNFCSEDQCNLSGLIAPGDGQFLLAGESNLNAFTEAVAWQSLMQAYEHYGLNPEMYSNAVGNYVEAMHSSEVGLYSQYTVAAKEVFTLPANERAAMDELSLTKANELALLNEWEAQFASSGAIDLSQHNQDLRTKLVTDAWDTSQSIASRATDVLNNTLSTAATLLADDLPSETNYTTNSEQSWKIQLALGIRPWNSGTAADLELLKSIAGGCPLTDGNGVFRARALLAFLHGSEEIYSDDHCREKEDPKRNGRVEPGILPANINNVATSLRVFPNPSRKRQVQVICPKNTTNAKLHLKTPQGQALHQWNLSEGQREMTIHLDALPPGLYYLQWSSGEKISTTKLILQ